MLKAGLALALAALAVFTGEAQAQYPERPVKIIVPYAPGGTSDFVARIAATKISEATGKTFLVENRTGAGGRVGYEAGAKSEPDGYTLIGSDTSYAMMAGLYSKLNWDHLGDVRSITITAQTPVVITVSNKSGIKSLKELIERAKAKPGELNYGSGGSGSSTHLAGELFNKVAGVKITHVPFRGAGDAVNALLNGTVDLLIAAPPTVISQVKGNLMTAVAVSSDKRSPAMPDVPTTKEAGLGDFMVANWFGLMAPKGTPDAIVNYIQTQVKAALALPEVRERLASQGAEPVGNTPAEADRILREDTRLWGDTIKASGIKLD